MRAVVKDHVSEGYIFWRLATEVLKTQKYETLRFIPFFTCVNL